MMAADLSIKFAQLWGGFYVTFGALFVITGQLGRTIEMTDDKPFIIGTGYTSFFLGLATVVWHPVYVMDWRVIITFLGWATLIKGIQKIGFPDHIHRQAQRFKKGQSWSGAFLFSLGSYLLWMSFFQTSDWI